MTTDLNLRDIHTPGDRVERSAQSRLPLGLSDRSCGHGKSRQLARPRSERNLISGMSMFSLIAQTLPDIRGKVLSKRPASDDLLLFAPVHFSRVSK